MLGKRKIEELLINASKELCVAVAGRSALRTLPVLVADRNNIPFHYWEKEKHNQHLLAIIQAQAFALGCPIFTDLPSPIAVYTSAADVVTMTTDAASAYLASDAALAASAAAVAVDPFIAATDAIINANAAFKNTKYELAIHSDLGRMNKVSSVQDFLESPLFPEKIPTVWLNLWIRFWRSADSLNSGFGVWLYWLRSRVLGQPFDLELTRKWLDAILSVELQNQGAKAVNAYLGGIQNSEKPLNLVRAIFIGDGAAGKTSLIRALHDQSVIKGEEPKTPGIQIYDWPGAGNDISVRFWDFGGQVINHATHQFFLREKCLYILVLDQPLKESRDQVNVNGQAKYWLEHIKSFAEHAPVMVVGNKLDENKVILNEFALHDDYRDKINIVGFYLLSCTGYKDKYQSHFETFRGDLIKQLQKVGTHQIYFSNAQFAVLNEIRHYSRNCVFLTHKRFESLYAKYNIGKTSLSRDDYLGLLDSLGEIVHFPRIRGLSSYIINPRWLTYGVYALLNSEIIKESRGIISISDVTNLLKTLKLKDEQNNTLIYPRDTCSFMIDLMEEFKLCYYLPENRNCLVFPEKLPNTQPKLKFDKEQADTLQLEFGFNGFVPRHLMPALIVIHHNEIANRQVWQQGVIIFHDLHQATARIQVNYEYHLLSIWVQGIGKREYLEILMESVRRILKKMQYLEYETKIILPLKALIGERLKYLIKPEKVSYQQVVSAVRNGDSICYSTSGQKYDLSIVIGFIMSEKKKKNISVQHNIVHGSVGSISGISENQQISSTVTISPANYQVIDNLKQALTSLLPEIMKHDTDIEVKMKAYDELKLIRDSLDKLENISPAENGKLRQLLEQVQAGTTDSIKMIKKMQDGEKVLSWLADKVAPVIEVLGSLI